MTTKLFSRVQVWRWFALSGILVGFFGGAPLRAADEGERKAPSGVYALRKLNLTKDLVDTLQTQKEFSDRRWYLGLDFSSNLKPGQMLGGRLSLGWQPSLIGVELGTAFHLGSYGAFKTVIDPSVDLSTSERVLDSDSELNRPRFSTDPWTQIAVELLLNLNARYLVSWLPKWSQFTKVGLGYALMTDASNALSFRGFYYRVQAGMQYHFSRESPWACDFALGLGAGEVLNATNTGASANARALPILWGDFQVGLQLYL